jgi:hypothetical protein
VYCHSFVTTPRTAKTRIGWVAPGSGPRMLAFGVADKAKPFRLCPTPSVRRRNFSSALTLARPDCSACTSRRRAEPKPFLEFRPASATRDIRYRDRDHLFLAGENDEALTARDAGIEEITLQHCAVLGENRDDHGGIFGALTLVDGGGIGGNQRRKRVKLTHSSMSLSARARGEQ